MIKELDEVILTCDLPEHGLNAGGLGKVMLMHCGRSRFFLSESIFVWKVAATNWVQNFTFP
ncbi:MAG: hypothetical protein ACYDH9_13380 [Limisphaerales bacterium]